MEPTTQWKFRVFWPWQDDREEAWLGELSRKGWHLSGFRFPDQYRFVHGDPKNFAYRLDYQSSRMKDREAYLQLFQDAGWEHVGKMASWEYFRKEARAGEEPEIFTDPESKIRKYRQVLGNLTLLLAVVLLLGVSPSASRANSDAGSRVLLWLTLALLGAYLLAIIAVLRRIGELKILARK
jgi:hypothetical protein